MKFEIERKFLVKANWPKPKSGLECVQGYISADAERVVRIRTMGSKGWLTIKSIKTHITRIEYEYEIPFGEAQELLNTLCIKPLIEKTRFTIFSLDQDWEIDVFHGENIGLIVAEVELESEDESIQIPDWVGKEVTEDSRYYNANLSQNSFTSWKK